MTKTPVITIVIMGVLHIAWSKSKTRYNEVDS